MKTAAVSELKARLSKYLNRVKAGEEVLITDRGNPVARLLPISRARAVRETMLWAEEATLGAEFVCLDQNLRDAAFKEGFTVLPSI